MINYELLNDKKMDPKYKLENLFLEDYNHHGWFENEELSDTTRKSDKEELSDTTKMYKNLMIYYHCYH